MIYDRIENIETYTAISERLAKGLRLLRTTDFSAMEAGKYEVDGTELYYMLQCYQSKEQNDKPEAHKKYIDIQYISANPEGDIWFYHGPVTGIKMEKGNFAVFFPQDAHAPGIATGDPAPVKKVVVKVLA